MKFTTSLMMVIMFVCIITAVDAQQPETNKSDHLHQMSIDHKIMQDDPASILARFRKSNHRNSVQLERVQLTQPLCELRASEYVANSFVSPPENFKKKDGITRSVDSDCHTLRMIYNFDSGVDPAKQAQFINAYEFAAAIWESQLSGDFPVIVEANFTSLDPGVLGSAGANFIWRAAPGFPFYGEALAQEVFGQELSEATVPDIRSNFNLDFAWYLGTDGQAPPGTYDFVTVVLHELGHGLGFFGSAAAIPAPTIGVYGVAGSPFIYDVFVEDGNGNALTDIAPPNVVSPALGVALQGGDLLVNSPSLPGAQPIFTPFPFQGGSSYSHWDEVSFPPGTPNSLMTPQLGFQEANHDPGSNTLAMFSDHGWILSEDCAGPVSQDLSERCDITGISPDPNFPPFLCDNPGVFSPEGGAFGPVGSHVMCIRVDGIDPFNQPLDENGYSVKVGGKNASIIFRGYDEFQGEQYFTICIGGVQSSGKKNRLVKVKLAPGCTYTQGKYYNAPDCEEGLEQKDALVRSLETGNLELMSLSPNPVSERLFIELDEESIGKVIIQDYSGKRMSTLTNEGGSLSVNVSNFNTGIYFATFVGAEKTITKKFIKI